MRWRSATVGAAALALVAATSGVAAAGTSGWTVGQHPAPPDGRARSARAEAVSCGSPTHCVSVGEYASLDPSRPKQALLTTVDPTTTLTTSVAAPLPAGADVQVQPQLTAAACGAAFCVAGGSYATTGGSTRALLERQVAPERWRVASLPGLGGAVSGAACSDAQCVLAVARGAGRALVVRTATRWSTPSITLPAGETLGDVHPVCPTVGTCVAWGAAGTASGSVPVLVYPSGSGWTAVPFAVPTGVDPSTVHVGGMSCTSTANCVAVGSYDEQPFQGDTQVFAEVLEHGVLQTTAMPLPAEAQANPGIRVLTVSCGDATDPTCLVLTEYGADAPDDGPHGNAVFVVNGGVVQTDLTTTFTPLLGDLSCATSAAATRCVGTGAVGQRIQLFTYRHTSWSSVTLTHRPRGIPAEPSDWAAGLTRISCSGTSCAAVGGWATLDQGQFPHDTGSLLATRG